MLMMPEGCSKSLQVSFISAPWLRPHPESCWLYEAVTAHGTLTGVATSLESALEYARKELDK